MQKLWAVVQREYLERVRTRWFVLATIFGPIVFGTLMFLPAYMASKSRASTDVARIRILDATDSDLGRRVASSLNGGLFGDTTRTGVEAVVPAQLAAAESTAINAVLKGSAAALAIKFTGSVLGFAMFALAARSMEAHDFGTLAVIFNAMSFLAVIAACGQETLIVRSWDEYCGSQRPALASGALRFGGRT